MKSLSFYTWPAQHMACLPHAARKNFCSCRKCCNSPTSDIWL